MQTRLDDEVNEQEFMYYLTRPIVIAFTIIITIAFKSLLIIFAYFAVLFIFKFSFLILRRINYIGNKKENYNFQKSKLRTIALTAEITQIILYEDIENDYLQIICEYDDLNNIKKKFKSKKIVGQTKCKKGDKITVMVEPDNYDNYEVLVEEILNKK